MHNLPCLLKQISIVCPQPREKEQKNYYHKELWLNLFKVVPHVKLVYIDYIGFNVDHSYDQWIQGYLNYTNYDYNLLMEDDYCIYNKYMFDEELIQLYKEIFPNNIGYLASKTNDRYFCHASVSNGVISSDTFKIIKNILEQYYDLKSKINYPQLRFSQLFHNNSIPIKGISHKYKILFGVVQVLKLKL